MVRTCRTCGVEFTPAPSKAHKYPTECNRCRKGRQGKRPTGAQRLCSVCHKATAARLFGRKHAYVCSDCLPEARTCIGCGCALMAKTTYSKTARRCRACFSERVNALARVKKAAIPPRPCPKCGAPDAIPPLSGLRQCVSCKNRPKYIRRTTRASPWFVSSGHARLLALWVYGTEAGGCGCGETRPDALQLDHINGNRNSDPVAQKGKGDYWKRLYRARFPEGYQTLCATCHFIKTRTGRPPFK